MRYELIQEFTTSKLLNERDNGHSCRRIVVSLREACDVLDIREGSYSKWRKTSSERAHLSTQFDRKQSSRRLFDQRVNELFIKHKRKCGYRRLATCVQQLKASQPADSLLNAVLVTEKTVRQSMRRQGLKVKVRQSFKPSMTERTDIADTLKNLLLTNSGVDELLGMPIDYSSISEDQGGLLELPDCKPYRLQATQPRQVLVSDITYLPTVASESGWTYLCAWQDQYTKRVLGHTLAYEQTAQTMCEALRQALNHKGLDREYNMICHADGGGQYTGNTAKELLTKHKAARSITRRGNTHDNAQAESLWARLKCDLDIKRGYKRDLIFRDLAHAKAVIDEYIGYYNSSRPHSSLANKSPITFEHCWERKNKMSKMPKLEVVPPSTNARKTTDNKTQQDPT